MDREKVIQQLEYMRDYHRSVGNNITADIANDAVELLKEQEPKVAKIDGQFGGIKYGPCPKCGKGLNEEVYPHWCGFCGKEVKWDD